MPELNPNLLNVVIANIPAAIGLLREAFHKAQPNDPKPTDDDMLAALEAGVASSIAKDDLWLAQHPEDGEDA